MPVLSSQQIYFGNGTSLLDADALFLDSGLTQCAPDGWYSDGTIVRFQTNCLLLPYENCNCGLPCSNTTLIPVSGGSPEYPAQYNLNLSTTNVGAIVVKFSGSSSGPAGGRVFGFLASYNGSVYNKASGNLNGVAQGQIANQFTFVGRSTDFTPCALNLANTFNIEYNDWDGSGFIPTGTLYSVYTDPLQNVVRTAVSGSYDNKYVMVIPKTTATPTNFSIQIARFCECDLDVQVVCPESLPSFKCSNPQVTSVGNCNIPLNNIFYVAGVNGFGSGSGLRLGLYDLVFQDPYGQYPLVDGFYRATTNSIPPQYPYVGFPVPTPNDNYMEVQNGVIVDIFNEPTCGSVWP
jgi:hypothetical protein